jgi:NADH-quinone oxidoreductase subunit I
MPPRTVVVQRRPLNFWERIYIVEIIRGTAITGAIFWRNLFRHILHAFGIAKGKEAAVTIQCPEVKRPLPDRYRTRHRLMKRADGTERCVACMMCETVCPAYCIEIVAEEHPDPVIEKRPRSFVIDLGKCIYCGHCTEVCPCDAIRMDTKILEVAALSREQMIYTKDDLMNWTELADGSVVDLARRAARPVSEPEMAVSVR